MLVLSEPLCKLYGCCYTKYLLISCLQLMQVPTDAPIEALRMIDMITAEGVALNPQRRNNQKPVAAGKVAKVHQTVQKKKDEVVNKEGDKKTEATKPEAIKKELIAAAADALVEAKTIKKPESKPVVIKRPHPTAEEFEAHSKNGQIHKSYATPTGKKQGKREGVARMMPKKKPTIGH